MAFKRQVPTAAPKVDPAPAPRAKVGTVKVAVCCKVPNGLRLRLHKFVDRTELMLGGGSRSFKVAEPMPEVEPVRLRGPSVPHGLIPRFQIAGGFGVTMVDKEFWDEWKRQNKDADVLVNGLVFDMATMDTAIDAAEERADIKSGLEALRPSSDPNKPSTDERIPRTESMFLTQLSTDDGKRADFHN